MNVLPFVFPMFTQDGEYEDIEAEIDKELEEEDEVLHKKHKRGMFTVDKAANDAQEEEERWPTPLEPLDGLPEPDGEEACRLPPPPPLPEAEIDEDKKYILEKIQQANRELQDQEAPDLTRRRRLQFKDKLVDLVVPAADYGSESTSQGTGPGEGTSAAATASDLEGEMSGRMLQLKISPQDEGSHPLRNGAQEEVSREGRVLVEKDGKFDLVSLKEVESQGLLPPLNPPSVSNVSDIYNLTAQTSPRKNTSAAAVSNAKSPTSSPRPNSGFSPSSVGADHLHTPKPPPKPRLRPNSASHTLRHISKEGTKRRVQSASSAPAYATFTLTPQQKEHLLRLQQKRERLAKEVGNHTFYCFTGGCKS